MIKHHYRTIKKGSEQIINNMRRTLTNSSKNALVNTLKTIDKTTNTLDRLSYEILTIIALDYLVNVERDVMARSKFMHLDTTLWLDKIMEKYKSDMKNHYKFFESVVESMN